MADNEKVTIHSFDHFYIEQAIVTELQEMDPSLKLVPLRDIVSGIRGLVEATFYPHMAEFIGVEQVGDNDIIWEPTPLDDNWFQRLVEEGHTGKRILLSAIPPDSQDEVEPFSTTKLTIPGENITKQIHKVLTD
jgi:hypothetical protein